MADGVVITERAELGLATVMARKGVDHAAIGGAIGLIPPSKPGCASAGSLTLIGVGPDVWLALDTEPGPDWPEDMERRLEGLASVSDQSGGYVVFRFEGDRAGPFLQRGVAIDLHPEVFPPGRAATSVIAHIGVILWRSGPGQVFEVAVFRSYTASFRHWIAAQAV